MIRSEAQTGDAPSMAIETAGLGKRFGRHWALQDCSLQVPKGRVCALIGPNGAGKTTLLRLLTGLSSPTAGAARVLGRPPEQATEFLASIGYLAQEAPLYERLTANEHIEFGRRLNRRWDQDLIRRRLAALRIPCDRPVATLSGGQRAQVALGLALAKRPRVLLLDEPVAALDPLARREFLASLTEAVADGELTVVLSSHLVHDLERICDHIILLRGVAHPAVREHRPGAQGPQVGEWAAPQPGQPRAVDQCHPSGPDRTSVAAARASGRSGPRPSLGARRRRPRGDHPGLYMGENHATNAAALSVIGEAA